VARFDKSSVKGLRETRAAFKLVHPVFRRHMWNATSLTGTRIEQEAGRRVPVRSGLLNEAIDVTRSRATGVAKIGIRRKSSGTFMGRTVIPGRYAHLVEFGTVHSRPRPFMLPAAEGQRGPYLIRAKAAGKKAELEMAIRS
jgi:HK97 gp10 family phage protein